MEPSYRPLPSLVQQIAEVDAEIAESTKACEDLLTEMKSKWEEAKKIDQEKEELAASAGIELGPDGAPKQLVPRKMFDLLAASKVKWDATEEKIQLIAREQVNRQKKLDKRKIFSRANQRND